MHWDRHCMYRHGETVQAADVITFNIAINSCSKVAICQFLDCLRVLLCRAMRFPEGQSLGPRRGVLFRNACKLCASHGGDLEQRALLKHVSARRPQQIEGLSNTCCGGGQCPRAVRQLASCIGSPDELPEFGRQRRCVSAQEPVLVCRSVFSALRGYQLQHCDHSLCSGEAVELCIEYTSYQ